MRYLAIIVTLFLLTAQAIIGQSAIRAPGKFYVGAMAGVNATAIFYQNNYGQTEMDYVVPVGFAAGAAMHYRLTQKSHLIAEVSYQQMGQKHDDHFKGKDFYKDINLNYVAVPILYKLILNRKTVGYEAWTNDSKPKWYLLVGIQPSFLISADISYEVDGNQTDFISFITEGGNPNIEEEYGWIRPYTPYENITTGDYPALLITAGLNDPRVQYWEPAKWTAKLRTLPIGDRPLLLKTEMGAGHFARSGRYDVWRDEAFVLAFILDEIGTGSG